MEDVTHKMTTKFNDLPIGAKFDFIDEAHPTWNSFYDRCVKRTKRTYSSLRTGLKITVGTVQCAVYHVDTSTGA